jgi:CHAD domain-containing protein
VYVLEFEDYRHMVPEDIRADLDPLLGVLRNRRVMARREMVRALRSDRAEALRPEWASFLARLEALPEDDRPAAPRPIGELAGERISKVYRRMVKMGRAIDDSSPPEEYHELRKKGKELRYLLELFGAPLYSSEVVKPMIKALKSLQDVLGRHQDREVQVATLRSLRDEVSVLPRGAAALMAMGVLVERLGQDERAARNEFAERFAAFASKSQRGLVKDTFG